MISPFKIGSVGAAVDAVVTLGQTPHVCAQNDLAVKKYLLVGEQPPSCLAWAHVRVWSLNWAFKPVSKSPHPIGLKLPNASQIPTSLRKMIAQTFLPASIRAFHQTDLCAG